MKLIWKFNLVLLAVVVLSRSSLAAVVSYTVLQANAREEILQNARADDGVGAVRRATTPTRRSSRCSRRS